MKKLMCFTVAGLWVAFVSISAPLAQSIKMGFVNTLEVLYGTEEGKQEIEKLNQFAAGKQQEVVSQTEELQKLQEQYASQQRTLNADTRSQMERKIQDGEIRLKRTQEDAQLEYDKRRNELLGQMSEKIRDIINEYAPANGFGVIFLRNESQTFVDLSLDVTQEIIGVYNQRFPTGG